MLQHQVAIRVKADPDVMRHFREKAFTSQQDCGTRKPTFTPEWLLPPPAHVARWNESFYSDRLAAKALFGKAIPNEARGIATDLQVGDDFVAFANEMGPGRRGLVMQMVSDLQRHGPDFAQRWIDNNWGSVIDASSTVVYQCRLRDLLFSFTAHGCRPPDDFIVACRGYFHVAADWVEHPSAISDAA